MRVAIVGSRRRRDYKPVERLINELDPAVDVVVTGGAEGVDSVAERLAGVRGIPVTVHLPDLSCLESSPYFEVVKRYYARNERIVLDADEVHAFVALDRKGGTENTIRWARKYGLPLFIYPEE